MPRHFQIVLLLLLVAVIPATASAQVADSDESLARLRDSDRAPVTQLVNDFLRYQRSQQWDLLYNLFSPTYIRPLSRTEYVEKRQTATAAGRSMYMLDFSLRRVLVNDPFDGQYSLAGCANVLRDGRVQFTNAHVDVVFEKDVWRIAGYSMFATCLPPDWECKE